MLTRIKAKFTGPQAGISVLIASAVGVALSMAIAGSMVYINTRNLITARDWVEHTQDVMLSLQRAGRQVERVDADVKLYAQTKDTDDLNLAHTAADQFRTAAVHLQVLTQDNPGQQDFSQNLVECSNSLQRALDGLRDKGVQPAPQIEKCQQTMGLMTELETRLLKERGQTSQHNTFISIAMEIAFAVLVLLLAVIMFAFLLRDAILRQRNSAQTRETNLQLATSVKQLEDRAQESEALTVCRDELQLCLDAAQVYKSTTKSMHRLLPETKGCLCMINSSRNMVEVVARWGETSVEDFAPPESCCGLRAGYPRWREPGASEIDCTHFGEASAPERYLCLPIVAHGNGLGVLYVECADKASVEDVKRRLDVVRQFIQLMGMTVATLNLQAKLENQSIRDSLTGLFNRHFMQVALDRELSRAVRRNDTLAVFMLDVDHFKKFNDTHGHAAGDTVLRAVADVFRDCVRAEDVICRYGGEEFTIILPDVTATGAFERAEGIRQAVERLTVPTDHVTFSDLKISIGIALFPSDGRSGEDLLRRADQALYRAKRQGRNQVSLAELGAPAESEIRL